MKKLFLLLALSLTTIFAAQANKPFVIHAECHDRILSITVTPEDNSKPYFLQKPACTEDMGGMTMEDNFNLLKLNGMTFDALQEMEYIYSGTYEYVDDEVDLNDTKERIMGAVYVDADLNTTSEWVILTFTIAEGLDVTSEDVDDGIEQINAAANLGGSSKLLHDGHLFILRDNHLFNAHGARVK